MLGLFSGIVLAIWYRKEGPQEPVPEWINEETNPEEDGATNRTLRLRKKKVNLTGN